MNIFTPRVAEQPYVKPKPELAPTVVGQPNRHQRRAIATQHRKRQPMRMVQSATRPVKE